MALTTPEVIDTEQYTKDHTGFNQAGPYEYGGAIWIAGYVSDYVGVDKYLHVFKTTDYGETWTNFTSSFVVYEQYVAVSFRNGIFTIGYKDDATGHLGIIEFNTATESYGPVSVSSIDIARVDEVDHLTDGTKRLIYQVWISLPDPYAHAYYVDYLPGGTWGTPVLVSTDVGATDYGQVRSATRDDSDDIHTLYVTSDAAISSYAMKYRKIRANGSLGPIVSLGTLSTDDPTLYVSRPTFWGTRLIILYDDHTTYQKPYAYITEDFTVDTPTFRAEKISDDVLCQVPFGMVLDDVFYAWWIRSDESGADLDRLVYYTYDGSTWSSEVVVHDEFANPTYDDVTLQYLHWGMSTLWMSDDQWGIQVGMEVKFAGGQVYCTGHWLHGLPEPEEEIGGEEGEIRLDIPGCFMVIQKHPNAVLDVDVSYVDWLGTDTITSATVEAVEELTVGSVSISGSVITAVSVSGGTLGNIDYLKYTAVTSQGRTEVRYVEVRIENCLVDAVRVSGGVYGTSPTPSPPPGQEEELPGEEPSTGGQLVPGVVPLEPFGLYGSPTVGYGQRGIKQPVNYKGKIYGLFGNFAYSDSPPRLLGPQMWRSLDGGNTWALVDGLTLTEWQTYGVISGSTWENSVATDTFGNKIYMVWRDDVTDEVHISYFNMDTDRWTPDASGSGGPIAALGSAAKWPNIYIRFRSDGTALVVYPNLDTGYSPYRTETWYCTWTEAGGWGTPTVLVPTSDGQHYGPVDVVIDSSDNAHVFGSIRPNSASSVEQEIYHIQLQPGGTKGALQSIAQDMDTYPTADWGVAAVGYYGQTESIAIGSISAFCTTLGLPSGCWSEYRMGPFSGAYADWSFRSKRLWEHHAPATETPTWTTENFPEHIQPDDGDDRRWFAVGYAGLLNDYSCTSFFFNGRLYFCFSSWYYNTKWPSEKREAAYSYLWLYYKDPATGWSTPKLLRRIDSFAEFGDYWYVQPAPQVAPVGDGIGMFTRAKFDWKNDYVYFTYLAPEDLIW